MKKTKKGVAVLLLISMLLSMNITSVFATDSLVESNPKVYTEGTNTLNLEGNFTANGSDGAIWVKDGAQLTINGTDETRVHATLGADDFSMAVYAQTKGTKVVINGGYYTNETDGSERGTDLIYAANGAEIEINGGKFEAKDTKWTLNCKDNTASTITVKGGTFYKFDPSNANVGEGEIVVPDGYGVVKNGDWYTVFKTVYAEGTNTLNLEGKLTANGSNGAIWVKDGAQLTINGTDETEVHAKLGSDNYSMALWVKEKGTKVVINGGYYTNETDGSERGTDLIYASNGAEIEINGGKFEAKDTKWTLNCKDNTASTITVKGGTFYKFDPSNANVGEGEIVVPDGYRVVKNGDWYTVYKENTITVEEVEGGTVSASLTKAIVGETVELTATPDDGYELKSLKVITVADSDVTLTNGKFVMPDMGVIVIAEFTKIIPPMDYVISGDETENNNLGVVETEKTVETLDESLKADTKLNEKVEEERQNGNQVTIEITMEELDKETVKEEEKQQILQTITANQTVHQYFDISVLVKTQEKELGKLTQLTEKMKFSMEISEDLVKKGRTFFILKLHGDKVEKIEATLNGTKLEFETDQFSTFALAYEDVETSGSATAEPQPPTAEKDETPKTGVISISAFVWVAIASIAFVAIVNTKKSSKHSR